MFRTIHIIALVQGLFLLVVLFKTKNKYLKPSFWLLTGSIVSILLYIIGDDDFNFLRKSTDFFFLDKSLFITFLFLFVRYYIKEYNEFDKRDLVFFTPNILYFLVEIYEKTFYDEPYFIEIPELILELTFFSYLLYTIYLLGKNKNQKWMLLIIVPLAVLINIDIINDFLWWFHISSISIFSDEQFSSYTLVLAAFLFYFLTLKLIVSPKQVLGFNKTSKYKSSGLNASQVELYKQQLINLMEVDNAFMDPTLSIQKVSERLNIPRQYVSEILNSHMKISFQDFVNNYRIKTFTELLQEDKYNHYTILGIAKEVGFNSKATFYSSFKKLKGVTPSEFKRALELV